MSSFSTRWSVLQAHDVGATDVDADGSVADEALQQWITDACTAYVDQCSHLESVRAAAALRVRYDIAARPPGAALVRPVHVTVSASTTEVFPTSFVVSLRLRFTGGEMDEVLNTTCTVVLEDPATGQAQDIDRDIRDELIALEHGARHFN